MFPATRKIHRASTLLLTLASCLTVLLSACTPAASSPAEAQVTITPPASNASKTTVNGTAVVTQGAQAPAGNPTVTPNPNPITITPAPVTPAPIVQIKWLGHSTFLLTSSTGTKVLIDPVSNSTGYNITPIAMVDAVTISHEHGDHTNVSLAPGTMMIMRGLTSTGWNQIDMTSKGVRMTSLPSSIPIYHDNSSGTQRGRNSIFVFQVDGLRIAHLGDLGHTLSTNAIMAIGQVDVVMIPVGGSYTIDAAAATAVVDQLKPKIVLPMHYKTPVMNPNWPGANADAFLTGKTVQRPNNTTLSVSKTTLPAQTTVVVLNYQ